MNKNNYIYLNIIFPSIFAVLLLLAYIDKLQAFLFLPFNIIQIIILPLLLLFTNFYLINSNVEQSILRCFILMLLGLLFANYSHFVFISCSSDNFLHLRKANISIYLLLLVYDTLFVLTGYIFTLFFVKKTNRITKIVLVNDKISTALIYLLIIALSIFSLFNIYLASDFGFYNTSDSINQFIYYSAIFLISIISAFSEIPWYFLNKLNK